MPSLTDNQEELEMFITDEITTLINVHQTLRLATFNDSLPQEDHHSAVRLLADSLRFPGSKEWISLATSVYKLAPNNKVGGTKAIRSTGIGLREAVRLWEIGSIIAA